MIHFAKLKRLVGMRYTVSHLFLAFSEEKEKGR
jgi:hypothetical protein